MQRYNPMTKCLETVKTTDSIYSDMHNKINKYNANAVMYNILEDARKSDDKKEVKRCIQECKQIIKKFPYREDQSVSSSTITSKLKFAENKLKTMDRKTVDAGYDSPSQMESKLKNFVNKAKTANSKQELEKINNDLFFYVAKLKSNVLKKYGTANNKFNSTEEWKRNYSKIASKYMGEVQKLVDNFKTKDNKTVDAVRFSIRKYEHHYREFGYAIYDNKVKGFLAKDKKIVYFDTKEEAKKWLTNILNKNGMKNVL